MNDVYQIKSFDIELKDVDAQSRIVKGAFTKYNVLDSDGDIGRKGMFTKSWSENFSRIKHLLNHDTTKPVGKIKALTEDNDFAYYEAKIGEHDLGNDFIKMAESGLITEHSYGYRTIKQNKTKDGNELIELKHFEVSPLTAWGANQYTPIISLTKGLNKQEQEDKIAFRIKSLEKFCRSSTATDETIELLLLELKQIHQLFITIKATEPDTSTQPDTTKSDLVEIFRKHSI